MGGRRTGNRGGRGAARRAAPAAGGARLQRRRRRRRPLPRPRGAPGALTVGPPAALRGLRPAGGRAAGSRPFCSGRPRPPYAQWKSRVFTRSERKARCGLGEARGSRQRQLPGWALPFSEGGRGAGPGTAAAGAPGVGVGVVARRGAVPRETAGRLSTSPREACVAAGLVAVSAPI